MTSQTSTIRNINQMAINLQVKAIYSTEYPKENTDL